MALHLLSADRLGNRLASDTVSPREQAHYVVVGFVVWLLVSYLPIMHAPGLFSGTYPYGPLDSGPFGPIGLWLYELVLLIVINVVGVFYCLPKCRVEPRRNFLVDFFCLSTPVTVTTLAVVWGIFHLYASVLPWWLQFESFQSRPKWFELFYSIRFLDLMRFLAMVMTSFLIFLRVGNYMERVAALRESADDSAVQGTLASDARSGP